MVSPQKLVGYLVGFAVSFAVLTLLFRDRTLDVFLTLLFGGILISSFCEGEIFFRWRTYKRTNAPFAFWFFIVLFLAAFVAQSVSLATEILK